MEGTTADNTRAFIDPDLWDHGSALAAIALVFIVFSIAASIGFAVARIKPVALRHSLAVFVLMVSVVLVPFAHIMLPPAIVP